jgi:hypothetical protein
MMFKIFLGGEPARGAGSGELVNIGSADRIGIERDAHFIGWLALLLLIASTGCRALAPLPPANFQQPGWKVQSGQAVWRLGRGKSDIAGEVLYATNPVKQRTLVQFSKPPFILVIAQTSANHWAVEFPPENRHYSGIGLPPKRLIWLQLSRVLAGKPVPENWIWHSDSNGWHLENRRTGESLEGFFAQ